LLASGWNTCFIYLTLTGYNRQDLQSDSRPLPTGCTKEYTDPYFAERPFTVIPRRDSESTASRASADSSFGQANR
ncbi:hypothetical protein J6590_103829, partial [Homalodisca vitripennis]